MLSCLRQVPFFLLLFTRVFSVVGSKSKSERRATVSESLNSKPLGRVTVIRNVSARVNGSAVE